MTARRFVPGSALVVSSASLAMASDAPSRQAVRKAVAEVYADERFTYRDAEDSWFSDALTGFAQFMADFHTTHPVLFWILLVVLLVVCLILIAHIVWTLRMANEAEFEELEAPLGDSIAALNPEPFLQSADRAWRDGDRATAIRDLYAALLISLDRTGVVRYSRHKALLDYRLEARSDPGAAELLTRFEQAYHPGSFGRRPPDDATFAELRAQVGALS